MKQKKAEKQSVFAALGILLLGIVMTSTALVVSRGKYHEPETPMLEDSINRERTQAMEQAMREGKREYSFTIQKAPAPIGP